MTLNNNLDTTVFDVVTATLTNPGAGNQFSFPVDANSRCRILACRFKLIIGNAGSSRLVDLAGYDGTNSFCHSPAAARASINGTRYFYFAIDIDPIDLLADFAYITGRLSDALWLNTGDSFVSYIQLMNADVEIEDIVIRYQRWISE